MAELANSRTRLGLFMWSDPDEQSARKHLHVDMHLAAQRRAAFAAEDERTRSLVLSLLTREIERRQPGLRAGGFTLMAGALTTTAIVVGTYAASVLSSSMQVFAGLERPTERDLASTTGLIAGTLTAGAFAVAVILVLALCLYLWQRDTDRRRAFTPLGANSTSPSIGRLLVLR